MTCCGHLLSPKELVALTAAHPWGGSKANVKHTANQKPSGDQRHAHGLTLNVRPFPRGNQLGMAKMYQATKNEPPITRLRFVRSNHVKPHKTCWLWNGPNPSLPGRRQKGVSFVEGTPFLGGFNAQLWWVPCKFSYFGGVFGVRATYNIRRAAHKKPNIECEKKPTSSSRPAGQGARAGSATSGTSRRPGGSKTCRSPPP